MRRNSVLFCSAVTLTACSLARQYAGSLIGVFVWKSCLFEQANGSFDTGEFTFDFVIPVHVRTSAGW